MGSDLFGVLKTDHARFKTLLERLTATTETAQKTRKEGLERFRGALIPHMRAEEQVLYPAMKGIEQTRDMALEALEEHHAAETVLDELSGLSVTDETWGAKLEVFREMLEHHIEEEEGEVFRGAKAVFKDAQLDEIMHQMHAAIEDLKPAAA